LQKQRDEFAEIASARVLTKLLAVQDDLKRILDNGSDEIPKEHLEGIELLTQRIKGIFESENVMLIDIEEGKTKYDPQYHEAIVAQPIPGVTENTIVQIISSGFKKSDRVLRPAKVIISKSLPKQEKKDEKHKEEATGSTSSADKVTEEKQSDEESNKENA
jgi:molecular chaperone GrpE